MSSIFHNGITWHLAHPRYEALLGFIPQFLSQRDPASAAVQFDESYAHGGGWRPMEDWELLNFPTDSPFALRIQYPNDPPYSPIAWGRLRNEVILVFPHAWVAIVQPTGAFEVSRMD